MGKNFFVIYFRKFIGSKANSNNFTYDDFSVNFQKELKEKVESNYLIKADDAPMGISMKIFIEYGEDDDLSNLSPL